MLADRGKFIHYAQSGKPRRRPWLISPEGFRELRHSCLLGNQKAAARYLGVCVRTIRYWDAGRCRVPWSVVRLLRLLRAGQLGGLLEGWEGWTIWRDRLVSPDGRAYRERDMRHLWLTVTQAQLFREGYDKATLPASGGMDATASAPGRAERLEGAFQGRPASSIGAGSAVRPHLGSPGQDSPPPCRTALRSPAAPRESAGDSLPPVQPSGAAGRRAGASRAAALSAAGAGRHDANMTPQCSHTCADSGANLGACNMEQMASVSHSILVRPCVRDLPTANRGGTNLNEVPSGVTLASPCKGVA